MYRVDELASSEPQTLSLNNVTVAFVRWPQEHERVEELARNGNPQLLLVDGDASPPAHLDRLSDWIRLPADDLDLWTRVSALQRRVSDVPVPPPYLDDFDVLWSGANWVALSPIEARLLTVFLDQPRKVFGRDELRDFAWPDGHSNLRVVDSYIKRLRGRIAGFGIAIHAVRRRGYFLELAPEHAPVADPDD
jgi:Transcriptional regulatory protein, C terminal